MDREKVIGELQSALEWCDHEDNPNGSVAVKLWAVRGAVELLKEQTPRKETFWDSMSEADLMEPMRHFKD